MDREAQIGIFIKKR